MLGKTAVSVSPLDPPVGSPGTKVESARAEIDIVSPQLTDAASPDDYQALTPGASEATSLSVAAQADAIDVAALSDATSAPPATADSESDRVRRKRGNGLVKLVYEQYNDDFPIVDGSTTQANIDDVYCLSFVMPECQIRLSRHPNAERFAHENAEVFDSFIPEDPSGVYHGLERGTTYYVVVEQDADQLRRDQEATRAAWEPELQQHKRCEKDDGRGFETCSCIYGNPCADEYGCKDWHARFAVATANGWKGF